MVEETVVYEESNLPLPSELTIFLTLEYIQSGFEHMRALYTTMPLGPSPNSEVLI